MAPGSVSALCKLLVTWQCQHGSCSMSGLFLFYTHILITTAMYTVDTESNAVGAVTVCNFGCSLWQPKYVFSLTFWIDQMPNPDKVVLYINTEIEEGCTERFKFSLKKVKSRIFASLVELAGNYTRNYWLTTKVGRFYLIDGLWDVNMLEKVQTTQHLKSQSVPL